jgi:hypothetical protein
MQQSSRAPPARADRRVRVARRAEQRVEARQAARAVPLARAWPARRPPVPRARQLVRRANRRLVRRANRRLAGPEKRLPVLRVKPPPVRPVMGRGSREQRATVRPARLVRARVAPRGSAPQGTPVRAARWMAADRAARLALARPGRGATAAPRGPAVRARASISRSPQPARRSRKPTARSRRSASRASSPARSAQLAMPRASRRCRRNASPRPPRPGRRRSPPTSSPVPPPPSKRLACSGGAPAHWRNASR